MKTNHKTVIFFLLALPILCFSQMSNDTKLLSQPAISANNIAFIYAEDLWVANKDGSNPIRLTIDEGIESNPVFSPDGSTIAFNAQYDGNTEVYVMPSNGGVPIRATYTATLGRDDISDRMGPNNIVMTWKDDNEIVYRSRKQSFNSFKGQLFLASKDGGLSEELPLPAGGFCSYSPDGSKLAFTALNRLYVMDFPNGTPTRLTKNNFTEAQPSWSPDGTQIVFTTWQQGGGHLYKVNTSGRSTLTQLTNQPGIYSNPNWSYNSNRIAFMKGSSQTYDDAIGPRARRATEEIAWVSINGGDITIIDKSKGRQLPHFT